MAEMTNQEVIDLLRLIEEDGRNISKDTLEAINIAIKALNTMDFMEDMSNEISRLKAQQKPRGEIIKCQDCKYRIKEWRADKRMKDKGYWVYGCSHFGEIIGYWGWGGYDDEFCSDAEMRGNENEID